MPPSPADDEIDRSTLFAGADRLPRSHFTLIEAPAGFGKTTLARQWWAKLKAQGVKVAWLSFTDARCSGGKALRCVQAAMVEAFRSSEIASGPSSQGDRVLFLNDIHHAAPIIVEAIDAALRDVGPGLYIVATSRKSLSVLFHDAGFTQGMSVFRWPDLAYSPDELRSLLPEVDCPETASALYYRLKGWPALVRLLHSVARRWPGAILDFSGAHTCIEDAHFYFLEEIYCELESRERAVFDLAMASQHLTPKAVEDMLGYADAANHLEQLAQYHGLLEECRGAFRVHELIRSLAQRPGLQANIEMQRRIANRFEWKGELGQAVFHAVEAQDGEYAADLLRRAGGWNTALQIGSGTLDRLCALAATSSPDLQLTVAQTYARLQNGRIAEARRGVDRLKQAVYLEGRSAAVRAEWLVLDMLVAHYQNRMITPDLVDRLHCELADEPGTNHRVLIVLDTHFRAYAYYDVGDYGKSLHWLKIAAQSAEDNELFYAQIYALVFAALANVRIGSLPAAVLCLREAELVAGQRLNGVDLQRHQSMIQIFGAFLAWEARDEGMPLAEIAAIEGRMLAGYDSWPPILLHFYICTSEMIARQQGLVLGLAHLDRGLALAQRGNWHRVAAELIIRKIMLCVEYGASHQAADLFATLDPIITASLTDPHLLALVHLARAWRALADGDEGEALDLLEPLNRTLLSHGHGSLGALGHALTALAKERAGDIKSAHEHLAMAIGPDRMRYSLGWFRRLCPLAGRSLADLWPSRGNESEASAKSLDIRCKLTDRELQTLRMVANGFCVKEIARILDIQPSTVAFYRKQGYRKLGISKRSQLLDAGHLDWEAKPGSDQNFRA